jgi:hypothetical protein
MLSAIDDTSSLNVCISEYKCYIKKALQNTCTTSVKDISVKWMLCESKCFNAHDGEKEIAYNCGVCRRALSCNDILIALLHTSLMYVYVQHTKKIELLLW